METFPKISVVLLSLLSAWTSTFYVTEARAIATMNEREAGWNQWNTGISLFDHMTDSEGTEGASGSPASPPLSVTEVEENNEQSVNEIGVNNEAGDQSGNEINVNNEADKLINELPGDVNDGHGTLAFSGEGAIPTEHAVKKRSIQLSDNCSEPSDDELRRKLLAGQLFDQTTGDTPKNPNDEWYRNAFSRGCSGDLNGSAINVRAMCPWTNQQWRDRHDRYPRNIIYAKCDLGCTWCEEGSSCQQLLEERHVLKRGECKDNVYEYTLAMETVPVACVCEKSRII